MVVTGIVCIAATSLIGVFGALVPAWRTAGREPYDLICEES
jgi:hypothetical protein